MEIKKQNIGYVDLTKIINHFINKLNSDQVYNLETFCLFTWYYGISDIFYTAEEYFAFCEEYLNELFEVEITYDTNNLDVIRLKMYNSDFSLVYRGKLPKSIIDSVNELREETVVDCEETVIE